MSKTTRLHLHSSLHHTDANNKTNLSKSCRRNVYNRRGRCQIKSLKCNYIESFLFNEESVLKTNYLEFTYNQ